MNVPNSSLKNIVVIQLIKIRRMGMVANETSLQQRPNDVEVDNYMSPNGLQH